MAYIGLLKLFADGRRRASAGAEAAVGACEGVGAIDSSALSRAAKRLSGLDVIDDVGGLDLELEVPPKVLCDSFDEVDSVDI